MEGEDLVDPQLARIGLGEGQFSRVRASGHIDRAAVRLVEPVLGDIYGRIGEGDGQRPRHPLRDMDELDKFRSSLWFCCSPADQAIEDVDEVLLVREGRLVLFQLEGLQGGAPRRENSPIEGGFDDDIPLRSGGNLCTDHPTRRRPGLGRRLGCRLIPRGGGGFGSLRGDGCLLLGRRRLLRLDRRLDEKRLIGEYHCNREDNGEQCSLVHS